MIFRPLASGSSGNATFLSYKGTNVLIDAGLSGRAIIQSLNEIGVNAEDIHFILVTHEHIDHIRGVGVLSRRFDIPVYAGEGTWEGMTSTLGGIAERNVRTIEVGEIVDLGSVGAMAFPIPHDSRSPMGFRFCVGRHDVAVATDIGHLTHEVVQGVLGCTAVLLESNYDMEMLKSGSYPLSLKRRIAGKQGHLSNELAARLAAYLAKNGTRYITLAHLSRDNNCPEKAMEASESEMTAAGVRMGHDVLLRVAERYTPGEAIAL